MNCEQFNDQLPEYLDKTLPAAALAAARDHVHQCDACQRNLARQEALAKSIRFSLHQETEGLSLSPEARRNILNTLNQKKLPAIPRDNILDRILDFFAILWRQPARAGAILLCLLLFISGSHFVLRQVIPASPPPTARDKRITYTFNVPIQATRHVDRRQGNMIVDSVVTEVGVVDADFSRKPGSPLSLQ